MRDSLIGNEPTHEEDESGLQREVKLGPGGLLVKPDDPSSLADGILKIFRNPSLAEELGRNGFREVRKHYSAAHMADRALEAYESVLSK